MTMLSYDDTLACLADIIGCGVKVTLGSEHPLAATIGVLARTAGVEQLGGDRRGVVFFIQPQSFWFEMDPDLFAGAEKQPGNVMRIGLDRETWVTIAPASRDDLRACHPAAAWAGD